MKFLIGVCFLIAFSCKKDPAGPPPNGVKDPRTYTWTVDTIAYPGSFQTLMTRMWASGPDNVYIVGHNDQAFGKMFHFDGTRWTDVKLNVSQGGTVSPPIGVLNAIHGFAPNNIYAVGERYGNPPASRDSAVIIHFDGVQWREQNVFPQRGPRLQSLWGAIPTDIWAAGTNTLLHHDGAQWSHFPIQLPGEGVQFFSMTGLSSSEVYMMGYRNDVTPPTDTSAFMLYRFDGTDWRIIDSIVQVLGFPPARFGQSLGVVSHELYSLSNDVYCLRPATWNLLFSAASPLLGIYGPSATNFFVVGLQSQIIHYNGTDAFRVTSLASGTIDFYSVWYDDERVFIVGHDGSRTYVARGN